MRLRLFLGFCAALSISCEGAEPSDVHTVTASFARACWIDAGVLRCWGRGADGVVHATPTRVDSSKIWRSVEAGWTATCGTKTNGSLSCWGVLSLGANGGSFLNSSTPVSMGGSASWEKAVAGFGHVCGLRTNGSLWCWGDNSEGQLGDGTTTTRLEGKRVGEDTWLDVAVGQDHSCALKSDHTIWCWGKNSNGEVGDGTHTMRLVPVKVQGTDWIELSVSYKSFFSCGLKQDGSIWCWGDGQMGALGELSGSTVPVRIAPTMTFESMRVGWETVCGVKTDGSAWCWGSQFVFAPHAPDSFGIIVQRTPTRTTEDSDWEVVAPEMGFMCGIKRDHSLWCWGENAYGEVGNGSGHFEEMPVHIVPTD